MSTYRKHKRAAAALAAALTGLSACNLPLRAEGEPDPVCATVVATVTFPALIGPPDTSTRCDYRVTGWPCEEDQLCAWADISDDGDFDPRLWRVLWGW